MFIEQKAHYSLYYAIKNEFTNILNVVDSFPLTELEPPVIAVDLMAIDFTTFEIGNYNNLRELDWMLDVYGKNKTQRDQAVFKLYNLLEKRVPVYDFDLGFPPQTIPQIGTLIPTKLRIELIRIKSEEVEEIQYRASGLYTAIIELL
ncbi:MAG: hypothetical protein ACUVT3_00705 [Ignavibacterium sp.]